MKIQPDQLSSMVRSTILSASGLAFVSPILAKWGISLNDVAEVGGAIGLIVGFVWSWTHGGTTGNNAVIAAAVVSVPPQLQAQVAIQAAMPTAEVHDAIEKAK